MTSYKYYTAIIFLVALVLPSQVFSQVLYPDSEYHEYYRILEIKNSDLENRVNIFPSIVHQYSKDSITWDIWANHFELKNRKNNKINILPIRLANHYNSAYARGYNDGALWKGKGYTGSVQGGLSGKYGMIEFTFAPIVYYSQNASFELAPTTGDNNVLCRCSNGKRFIN